jgi:hypothetical protein
MHSCTVALLDGALSALDPGALPAMTVYMKHHTNCDQ